MMARKVESEKEGFPHHVSFRAREHIEGVGEASCFSCLRAGFKAGLIKHWVDAKQTAMCPFCGADAVVAGRVDQKTLRRWHHESFCRFLQIKEVAGKVRIRRLVDCHCERLPKRAPSVRGGKAR
jgi:hypothetical protein